MIGASVARLLLSAAAAGVLLAGCATPGGPSVVDDNTGQMAQRASSRSGAGALYNELALAYFRRGQLAVALQQARKALSVEPDSAEAHNLLGLIYDRLEDPHLAEQHYQKAIAIEPRNSYIRNAYAASLCRRDRFQAADEQFRAALKNPLYKTPEVALTNAAVCALRNGERDKAERYLQQALRRNPLFPLALMKLAGISLDKGRYKEARRYLARFDKVARHTAESLWIGIRIERKLGDQDALASYQLELENRFPDSAEAQLMLESEPR